MSECLLVTESLASYCPPGGRPAAAVEGRACLAGSTASRPAGLAAGCLSLAVCLSVCRIGLIRRCYYCTEMVLMMMMMIQVYKEVGIVVTTVRFFFPHHNV